MQKFEYKVEEVSLTESEWAAEFVSPIDYPSTLPLDAFLQDAGAHGWELVSCIPLPKSDTDVILVLKRPQSEKKI